MASSLFALTVDGAVTSGGCDPCPRVGREPPVWPLPRRDSERVLHRFLGDVDIAEGAYERRHGSTELFTEYPIDIGNDRPQRVEDSFVRTRRPGRDGPRWACGCRPKSSTRT